MGDPLSVIALAMDQHFSGHIPILRSSALAPWTMSGTETPAGHSGTHRSQRVHRSRVLRSSAERVPPSTRALAASTFSNPRCFLCQFRILTRAPAVLTNLNQSRLGLSFLPARISTISPLPSL